ncbi:hypothetical protein SAMN04515617_12821 [Collimonas sp. OK242]|uniref:hypothetical protein n=1 Tax=Collimonas sp. OK242 TaxID=1798195 RepID=UPI0008952C89|nr:hypothetical protein [Collimonas sp. OK242]SDY89865.1 hypothetical protein SAMN04515617_12821 [Collimonas sp. OK242]
MNQTIPTVDISNDGKTITYKGGDGIAKWIVGIPSLGDWQRLGRGVYKEEALKQGIFRWLSGITENDVTVVFSPHGGLDFNLSYSVKNAKLIKIFETR